MSPDDERQPEASGGAPLVDRLIDGAPVGFALFDRQLRYLRVNDALARINGRSVEDHVGRTLGQVVPEIPREAAFEPLHQVLRTGEPVVDLEVTGKTAADPDAEHTWLVSYYPLKDADEVVALGAFVIDITERRVAEEALSLAREAAERARGLTTRLQAVTERLAAALTEAEIASVVVQEGVAALSADAGLVYVVAADGSLELTGHAGYPDEHVRHLCGLPLDASHPAAEAARSGELVVLESIDEINVRYPDLHGLRAEAGYSAVLAAPLRIEAAALGVVVFTFRRERPFLTGDRGLAMTIARQCAQALDRARRYATEREIAETLQHSVLPERLPDVDGVALAAAYRAGTLGMEVGGDWYDVIVLPRDRLGLIVGDVVGKGVRAASTMAQLRNALRVYALEGFRPASSLERLNRVIDSLTPGTFATLLFISFDPRTGNCRYANAGHPPALVRRANGATVFLDATGSIPLGVAPDTSYRQGSVRLAQGDTLILYTDGLVERRTRRIDDGLAQLEAAARGEAGGPEELLETLAGSLLEPEPHDDDVALLVLRYEGATRPLELRLPAELPALDRMRSELSTWLEGAGATDEVSQEIVLAAWEACANAIEHPIAATASAFEILAEGEGGVVSITVRDFGRWRPNAHRVGRGFGLCLVEGLMERVDISPGEAGTEIRMRRRLSHA